MQPDRFEELCSAYVINALEPDERKEFENALKEASEEQLLLFSQMANTANHLTATLEPVTPAPAVKGKLMAQLAGTQTVERPQRQEKKVGLWQTLFKSFSVIMVPATLAIVVIVVYQKNLRLNEKLNEQQSLLAQKEVALRQSQQALAELKSKPPENLEILSILKSPNLEVVTMADTMAGLDSSPQFFGKVFWDKNSGRAVVQFTNLPTPPPGKGYQLWVISGDAPKSAGVFFVDKRGTVYFQTEVLAEKDPAKIQAFAVTLEPKGGVLAPTGDMYLKGI